MFPLDWQFAIVTLAALAALWLLVRTVRRVGAGGDCADCASAQGDASCALHAAETKPGDLVQLGSRKR